MKFDDVKKLHQKKYRSQFGHFLVEGEHLILELDKAIQQGKCEPGATLYFTDNKSDLAQSLASQFSLVNVSQKQMSQLSGTKSAQGLVACVPVSQTTPTSTPSRDTNIYLHEVQDPGNLGTIIRTLVWFGGFRLLLSPNSVDPFNNKVVRASMGGIFHLPMELDVNLDSLSERFDNFAYLDLNGEPINSPNFAKHHCFLFGNEARGVPANSLATLNAHAFTIAGAGAIESLNLATCVSISAYQLAHSVA
jgi:TrmH family RNA methyltransferase